MVPFSTFALGLRSANLGASGGLAALVARVRMYGPRTSARYVVAELIQRLWTQRVRGSFSQHGEDLAVDALLGCPATGFYVDVGANDPYRFNNTMRFYRRGWRGINVEPDPELYGRLLRARSRDTNVNAGIGRTPGALTFHRMFPHTLSTFSASAAQRYVDHGHRLVQTMTVPVLPLATLLAEHGVVSLDLLSVDTEGFDLDVLASNDWARFRPRALIVEATAMYAGRAEGDAIVQFCEAQKYRLVRAAGPRTGPNAILVDMQQAGRGGVA